MIEGRIAARSGGWPEAGSAPRPADRIFLRGLVREVEIGVHQHEHGVRQRLSFDVTVEVGRFPAGLADDFRKVVNYETFVHAIDRIAAGPRVQLVETFAERLAAACLEDARVVAVHVRIEKLDVLPGGAAFGVEITRGREAG